jgi:hypothetical protein
VAPGREQGQAPPRRLDEGGGTERGPAPLVRARPARWREFRSRYFAELRARPSAWRPLLARARRGRVTLLYAAHDLEHNGALALKAFLDRRIRSARDS